MLVTFLWQLSRNLNWFVNMTVTSTVLEWNYTYSLGEPGAVVGALGSGVSLRQ